jgi:hypothetical protein
MAALDNMTLEKKVVAYLEESLKKERLNIENLKKS